MESETFIEYFKLQDNLNSRIAELEKIHEKHITCKNKCSACCMNFGILPIEFYAIKNALGNQIFTQNSNNLEECALLQNNSCSIYKFRPFICRTQGLPNVYFNDETEVWDLSVCELNFTNVNESYFTEENCLFMDEYNEALRKLNEKFIAENQELHLSTNILINVNELIKS